MDTFFNGTIKWKNMIYISLVRTKCVCFSLDSSWPNKFPITDRFFGEQNDKYWTTITSDCLVNVVDRYTVVEYHFFIPEFVHLTDYTIKPNRLPCLKQHE